MGPGVGFRGLVSGENHGLLAGAASGLKILPGDDAGGSADGGGEAVGDGADEDAIDGSRGSICITRRRAMGFSNCVHGRVSRGVM